MRRQLRDPSWITVRYPGRCKRCGAEIHKQARAFYYPNSRTLYCEHDDCGGRESRAFEAARFDESGGREGVLR